MGKEVIKMLANRVENNYVSKKSRQKYGYASINYKETVIFKLKELN